MAVNGIYSLGIYPTVQANTAWPSLCGQTQWAWAWLWPALRNKEWVLQNSRPVLRECWHSWL